MLKISDPDELRAILKLIQWAKFGDEYAKEEVVGSPLIARFCNNVYENYWLKDKRLQNIERERAVVTVGSNEWNHVLSHLDKDVWLNLDSDDRRSYLDYWFSPYELDDDVYKEFCKEM